MKHGFCSFVGMNLAIYNNGTETEVLVLTKEHVKEQNELILWNDDVNTFDHVITTLMDLCGHSEEQAHQCALIVHNNGKCSVKRGEIETLRPICTAILDRGISASIN
jgi:ATP-dependent Clp protease adaptor protein ClpS